MAALKQERAKTGDPIAAMKQRQADHLAELREAERVDGFTVRDLCRKFLDEHPLAETTLRDYAGLLNRNVLPTLGATPATKLTRSAIRAVIKNKAKTAPVTATRTLAALSSAYGWAMEEEMVEANPCQGVKRPTGLTIRDRNLSVDEIALLLRNLPAGTNADVGRAVEVILRTGQRPGEVLGMTWDEIGTDGVRTIPASRYKTRRAHAVPLPPQVLAVLGVRGHGLVFPRTRRDGVTGPIRTDTAVKTFGQKLQVLGIAPAGLHDLRRTFESRVVDVLRCDPFVAHHEVCGHVKPGLMRVYQQVSNLDAAREVLARWNDFLDALLVENVVTIKATTRG